MLAKAMNHLLAENNDGVNILNISRIASMTVRSLANFNMVLIACCDWTTQGLAIENPEGKSQPANLGNSRLSVGNQEEAAESLMAHTGSREPIQRGVYEIKSGSASFG